MYESVLVPWSARPSRREAAYRAAGLVRTRGTLFVLPPPEAELRAAFAAPPRPRTRMSAGAVALCKHLERGGASSEHGRPHPFWPAQSGHGLGSNEAKTAAAARAFEDMVGEAVWRNVVLLHAGVAVYEVRNARGYGMRWTLEVEQEGEREALGVEADAHVVKTTFRGFVEPMSGLDHELPAARRHEDDFLRVRGADDGVGS